MIQPTDSPSTAPPIHGTAHASRPENLLKDLDIDPARGLTAEEAAEMRERFGANRLPVAKRKSRLALLLEQFNNPLIFILLGAAVLTSVVSDISEAITIFVVVTFNAVIGYVQEQRASERLNAVKSLTAPTARVTRNGEQRTIPAEELATGDIVMLESGVRVPADIRLIDAIELTIDESMLTGEPMPAVKNAEARLEHATPLGDRVTMAYAGTTVRKGRAHGLVTGVGDTSEIGKITKGIAEAAETVSPLQERLAKFGKVMAIAIAVTITVIFGLGLLRGYNATQMLLTAIGLAVSAIPEGLPIAVTVALSIGVYQMARRSAIVRKMNAVETLGSTTIVCSDKTGTLTRNQMTTVMIATDNRIYTVTGGGFDPAGTITDEQGAEVDAQALEPLAWTLRVGLFCTESSFVQNEKGERELVGDPTEGAMIVAAEKAGLLRAEANTWTGSIDLPFESERMYMASRIAGARGTFMLVKGSPERILSMCASEVRAAGIRPLDTAWIEERALELSRHGLRVIATAFRPLDDHADADHADADRADTDPAAPGGYTFAGLHGIEDPPRDEARAAVMDAREAGIKVVMITGDHAATAASIADQLGLNGSRPARVITGDRLQAMSDDDLADAVERTDVYARVAPEHKLRIVRQMQSHGDVVAMTGDGVNDAPALKQADIGVAMGSGTDVAKEAAAMIVQDDNFATIVSAIRYGRVMFRNLQHMVLYVLCTSLAGVLTLSATVILGFPLPVIAVQLLWINLVTDGTSTIPLAYEKEHGDIMMEPPRGRSEGLLNWQMAERIIGAALVMMFGTLYVFETVLNHHGFNLFSENIPEPVMTVARTAAFTTMALFQIWNVHNSRAIHHSLFQIGLTSNIPLLLVTTLAILLQVAAVELPFMHPLLKTASLPAREWLLCLGASLSLIFLVELRKWAGRAFDATKARHAQRGGR
ncbi:MAG TPA: HAD-IC family P-type ATPase [Candidatus Kapabacteria bacterium]|nr:HAD-IC family P-type ATPase [Candidatus Kapabacteria bacterium]